MKYRPKRVDQNQKDVVAGLRELDGVRFDGVPGGAAGGACVLAVSVVSLHEVGRGVPDLMVGFSVRCGREVFRNTVLIEVKSPRGRTNPGTRERQYAFASTWPGDVARATSAHEAREVVMDRVRMMFEFFGLPGLAVHER